MVRILLTSDLHLSENRGFPIRQSERLNTLKKIINLAQTHDLLLIAGDLFGVTNPEEELVSEVASLFGILRKKEIHVAITPGENENAGGKIPGFMFALNAERVFGEKDLFPFVFDKDGQKIFIYGLPPATEENLAEIEKIPEEGFHVGLFHTKIEDSESTNDRLKIEDLKSRKLDFYALGHNHNFKLYKYMDTIVGAYPGSPEGTSAEETGDRYVLSLTVENNELTQIKRLTINTITIATQEISCEDTGLDSFFEIISGMQDEKVCAIVTLRGRRPYLIPDDRLTEVRKKFYDLVLIDNSNLSLGTLAEEYAQEKSLRGDFYRQIKKSIHDGSIPSDIDLNKLADLLSLLSKDGSVNGEESLCALLNA
ncbi:MAG TPA: DNA repair exonuclease [Spirochaetota bacterium]